MPAGGSLSAGGRLSATRLVGDDFGIILFVGWLVADEEEGEEEEEAAAAAGDEFVIGLLLW